MLYILNVDIQYYVTIKIKLILCLLRDNIVRFAHASFLNINETLRNVCATFLADQYEWRNLNQVKNFF